MATWLISGLASDNLLEYPTETLGLALGFVSLLAWVATVVVTIATVARTDWSATGTERAASAVVAAIGGLAVVGAALLLIAAWVSFQHTPIGP